MNKRERILNAINLKPVDRLPKTYRASDYISNILIKYFKIDKENYNEIQIYKELIKKIGADFYSSGSKLDKLSTYKPEYNGKKPSAPYIADEQLFYTIGINTILQKDEKHNVTHEIYIDPPWADYKSPKEINQDKLISKLDLIDFGSMKESYFKKHKHGDGKAQNDEIICMGKTSSFFMVCIYLRGMENFLMDLAFNSKMAEYITKIVGEFCLEFNRRELNAFGKYADYYGTWDDVAGNQGLLLSPLLFKKYILPFYNKLIDNVKSLGILFGWHCCGSIHEVLPMMIDAGIDLFDVVQTSARDMDIEKVYRFYGNRIAFHGGIDVQKLLIDKKPKDIKAEIRKIIDLWDERGGMILAPSHEIQPGTPIENILAIYEEINNYDK